jgi:thiol:disulfide interchange protein DsbA
MLKILGISAVALVAVASALWLWADAWLAKGDRPVTSFELVKAEKPKVAEFFMYGCSHCYALEESLGRWVDRNHDAISFVRVPAVFFPQWVPMDVNKEMHVWARTYYVIEQRDDFEMLHERIFDAIHIDKKSVSTEDGMAAFLATLGVDENAFRQQFDSDEVVGKVARAAQYAQGSYLRSTPTIVVNDHFRVSIDMVNNSNAELLSRLDDFVKQSHIETR